VLVLLRLISQVYCPCHLSIPRNAIQFCLPWFIVQVLPYVYYIHSRTTLRYSHNHRGMLHHSFHGAKIIWTSLVNAWMADQGTQNNESLHYQSTWMPMSHPMSSPLLVSLEWVICTQSYWAELVGRSPCIFIVSISADDMLTCLQASRILVCYLPEKYEKLKIDFSSTLLYLLSCSKAHFTMLFVNRYTMSPPSEGWIVKTRSSDYIIYSVEAEFIQRVVAQYGPCEYWRRQDSSVNSLEC